MYFSIGTTQALQNFGQYGTVEQLLWKHHNFFETNLFTTKSYRNAKFKIFMHLPRKFQVNP